jgi:hypothetical protein
MDRTVSLVKVALGGLWCRLSGERSAPLSSDEARIRFDREYDAILAEMVASLGAANASRRTAARGR